MEKVRCNECMPVVLQDFYDNDTLPFCSHFGEQKCMIHAHNFGIKEKFETCEYPMSDMEYSAITKKEDQSLLNSNHNYTTIKISFLSSTRTIKEEILVYDESTLIGTLGGFLGLFVGFSFFGLIGYFIEKLLSFFWDFKKKKFSLFNKSWCPKSLKQLWIVYSRNLWLFSSKKLESQSSSFKSLVHLCFELVSLHFENIKKAVVKHSTILKVIVFQTNEEFCSFKHLGNRKVEEKENETFS